MKNRPMICIPITDTTRDEIISRARQFSKLDVEMIEWRVDFFAGYEKEIVSVVNEIKRVIVDKKLVVTIRTEAEGGEKNGTRFSYDKILSDVVLCESADYVDVEIYRDGAMQLVQKLCAHNAPHTKIIGSYHDFHKTPSEAEMLRILEKAKQMGADVGKIACMPSKDEIQGIKDVQALLDATEKMHNLYPEFPIITMSMGEYGKVTRLYGGLYGSAVSFGCVGNASAPGQIPLDEMLQVFDKIYRENHHIALIGFMGVGKSTVSERLHSISGMPEYDTDAMIVAQEGKSIADIFQKDGERYFRDLETSLIDELACMPAGIISCGGGMALKELNVKKLKSIGNIVLLTASPETIYERVKDSTTRPLLNGNMNVQYIESLMEKRRPFYEKAATITVSTDGKTADEIACEIQNKCK